MASPRYSHGERQPARGEAAAGNGLVRCAVLIVALLAAGGCGNQANGEPIPTQTVGSLTARLTIAPQPPVPMQEAVLELALHDRDGELISGADVHFDLTMPDCTGMAPNRPAAREVEPGLYRAETVFTMAGAWQIVADISMGEEIRQFTFSVNTGP